MNTPVYREMVRLLNNRMNVSRNTVYNWFVKGSEYLKKVLPILKEEEEKISTDYENMLPMTIGIK